LAVGESASAAESSTLPSGPQVIGLNGALYIQFIPTWLDTASSNPKIFGSPDALTHAEIAALKSVLEDATYVVQNDRLYLKAPYFFDLEFVFNMTAKAGIKKANKSVYLIEEVGADK